MTTTTLFRADDYTNNIGDFLGFFTTLEDAKSELEFSNEVDNAQDGTFSQITEFTVLSSEFEKADEYNKGEMMKLWGEGEIVKDYFFVN